MPEKKIKDVSGPTRRLDIGGKGEFVFNAGPSSSLYSLVLALVNQGQSKVCSV